MEADGSATVSSSHEMKLGELRFNIVKTLMRAVVMEQESVVPDIWINSLGDVVETEKKPKLDDWDNENLASDLTKNSGGHWDIINLHPEDKLYRGNEIHPHCYYYTSDQFFPYNRDVREILPYLL